jgi:hypothetical protein
MSHTGLPAAHEYLEMERLAQRFVHEEVGGKAFADGFLELRRSILDSQDQRKRSWPKPYDELLADEYRSGLISGEDFKQRWEALWGYRSDDPRVQLMAALFTEIESYEPDPEVYAELAGQQPGLYIHNEEELRMRIGNLLRMYGSA